MDTTTVTIHPDFRYFAETPNVRWRIQNLAKLALYVHYNAEDLKDTFRMDRYLGLPDPDDDTGMVELFDLSKKSDHPCGTCACFAGHGPEAGIGLELIDSIHEEIEERTKNGTLDGSNDWYLYVDHVFVPMSDPDMSPGVRDVFKYLFSGEEDHPDCPETAARRTQALLKGYGVVDFRETMESGHFYNAIDEDWLEAVADGDFELVYELGYEEETPFVIRGHRHVHEDAIPVDAILVKPEESPYAATPTSDFLVTLPTNPEDAE